MAEGKGMELQKGTEGEIFATIKRNFVKDEQLMKVAKYIPAIIKQSSEIIVDNEKSQIRAGELTGKITNMAKIVKAKKDEFCKPINKLLKVWRDSASVLSDPLEEARGVLDKKVIAYDDACEAQRKKDEEKKAKEEKAKQDAIDKQKKKLEAAPTEKKADKIEDKIEEIESKPVTQVTEVKKTIRSEAGTLSVKKEWTHTTEDPSAVPREYLKVDEVAIGKAVKAGVREIAGVKIFERKGTSSRGA